MSTEDLSPTGRAIIDATFDVVTRTGLAKLALEDVAQEAGVSRQTVYRHFGNRDGLLAALIVREEEGMLRLVLESAEGVEDLEDAVAVGLAAALESAGEHPLLQRLLESEPEVLLPFLTLSTGPVLSIVGPTVVELVEQRAELPREDLDFLADAIGRLVVSLAINPSDQRTVPEMARRVGELVAAFVERGSG